MARSILLVAALAGFTHQTAIPCTTNAKLPSLKFRDDGKFQIAVFSDFHLAESAATPRGPKQDNKTIQVMADVLDKDRPDLVVLNGDLITGEVTLKDNSTDYIDPLVAPLVERNLTWASTYGNHDHTFSLSAENIFNREHEYVGARTQRMVRTAEAGVSNYFLPVYARSCRDTTACDPELLLWFFDSRGGAYYQRPTAAGAPTPQPNWVDTAVVEWFQGTNAEFVQRAGRVIPSLAFVHIPPNATSHAQRRIHPNRNPGIDLEQVSQQSQGWCANGTQDWDNPRCRYGGFDVPFMKALATTPGLMGLFYGHDHANTWCYRWDGEVPGTGIVARGINLCYGQHTGYGGYGDFIRGGREIVLDEGRLKRFEVDTYMRLEDGRTVGAVSLNATFNQDWYPATPNDQTKLE
ncbi:putative inactive purple acid phosphatase 16 [Metarhizium anisopliae]|nr:putative inactive purple acid phosphatase 16 [Metarhizium anisopliae]